jgi:hypothetical protein
MPSNITSTSSVPATPVSNLLPPTITQTFNGTVTVQGPQLPDVIAELENISAFLAHMQAALAANPATYSAFVTAMASLPSNP